MAIETTGVLTVSRAGCFDPTLNWTWTFWVQQPVTLGMGYLVGHFYGDPAYAHPYLFTGTGLTDPNKFGVQVFDGAVTTNSADVALTPGQWTFIAVTYTAAGTALRFYLGTQAGAATLVDTLTVDLGAIAFIETAEYLISDGSNFGLTTDAEYDRVWQRVLTLAQINAERVAIAAALTTNLLADTRVAAQANLTDASGNTNDWTKSGTLAYADGPLPPVNTTDATAIDVGSVPYSLTSYDVQDAPGSGHDVWFRYTAPVGQQAVGWSPTMSPNTNSDANLFVWTGTPGSLTEYPTALLQITSIDKPAQMPVTPGTTYYLQIAALTSNDLTDPLALTGTPGPLTGAPIGSIFIPTDLPDNLSVVFDHTDGTMLRVLNAFPAGEAGDVLPSGVFAVEAFTIVANPTTVPVYSSQFALISTPLSFAGGSLHTLAIRSDRVNTFYVTARTGAVAATLYTIDGAGVLGGTTWTLPANSATFRDAAPFRDGSTLLYSARSVGTAVHAFNIPGNAALPDFVAGIANYRPGPDILVLADGTVIVPYLKTGPVDQVIKHYSAAGAVLHTYSLGAFAVDHLCLPPADDSTSFWAWLYENNTGGGTATFRLIRVSDGATLEEFTLATFIDTGGVDPSAVLASGQAFGPKSTCPFLALTQPIDPAGTSTTYPIRRLRRFLIGYENNLEIRLRRLEFVCQPGTGLSSGQGSDPVLMFRLSRDGGFHWGPIQHLHIGQMGETLARAFVLAQGMGRQLVGEVSSSDPTTFALIDCVADLEVGWS